MVFMSEVGGVMAGDCLLSSTFGSALYVDIMYVKCLGEWSL